MNEQELKAAHKFSSHHRKDLEGSNQCGCFYCQKIFSLAEKPIKEWVDDNDTALCPYCGIDSVLSDNVGLSITPEFLEEMGQYWFGRSVTAAELNICPAHSPS